MNARLHKQLFFVSLGMGAAMLSSSAFGQISLDSAIDYAASLRPSGVAIGDLNGDGFADLATTTDTPDKINTLMNDGAGAFTAGAVIPLPASSSPQDIVAGDFDGDDDIDLAVVLRDLNQIRIAINNGGIFTLGASATVGAGARGMAMADIDGDGDLDLGVANEDSDSATVLLNNGDGTFVSITVPQPAGAGSRGVAFGNFTGPGPMQLAVSNHDTRTVNVFTQSGAAFVQGASLFVGANDRPDGIVAADLTGDGLDDIATVSGDNTPAANRVVLFIATGAAFTGPTYVPTGAVVNSGDIAAADLDCDGIIDLAVTNQDSANMSLLRNSGAGAFAAPLLMATGMRPGRVAAGDFNNDGDFDLAVANRDSNNVSVLSNTCGTPVVPGDITGDGIVNVADLLLVISSWGVCAGCPADVNNDGVVNVQDMLFVINNWG